MALKMTGIPRGKIRVDPPYQVHDLSRNTPPPSLPRPSVFSLLKNYGVSGEHPCGCLLAYLLACKRAKRCFVCRFRATVLKKLHTHTLCCLLGSSQGIREKREKTRNMAKMGGAGEEWERGRVGGGGVIQ